MLTITTIWQPDWMLSLFRQSMSWATITSSTSGSFILTINLANGELGIAWPELLPALPRHSPRCPAIASMGLPETPLKILRKVTNIYILNPRRLRILRKPKKSEPGGSSGACWTGPGPPSPRGLSGRVNKDI